MTVTISGSGITTPTLTNSGDFAVGGNQTVTGTSTVTGDIKGSNLSTTLYPLISGTVQTFSSNTEFSFTSIPSWVKRITIMAQGLMIDGPSPTITGAGVNIGDSGGYEISGYVSSSSAGESSTDYFVLTPQSNSDSVVFTGVCTLVLITGTTWMYSSSLATSTPTNITATGSKTLSGTLDRVRITTINGTDVFDAGSVNIIYE